MNDTPIEPEIVTPEVVPAPAPEPTPKKTSKPRKAVPEAGTDNEDFKPMTTNGFTFMVKG